MSPSGTGAKDVCLTMSVSGAVTQTGGFTYNALPTLNQVTPNQGPVAGGNVVQIEGTGYGAGLNVLLAGVPCTGVSVTGGTTITCTVPASQSGAGGKTLTIGATANGTQTFANAYSYRNLPTIQAIVPPSGPLAGLSTIDIGGTNFFGTPAVTIDGRACTGLAVTGSTTVTATTPSSMSGIGAKDVVVMMSASGTVTQTSGYAYNPLPSLMTVTPDQGPVAGGNVIIIDGSGFGSSGTNALIQGVPCTGLSVNTSGTQITCTVPGSQSGAGAKNLTIGSTSNGTQTFNGVYSYRNVPTITSIAPPSGPLVGDTTITIGGTSFFGAATVFVDGVTCTNVTVTTVPTTITAVTPMSGSGAGAKDVVVMLSASGTATQTGGFAYNPPPTLDSVTPNEGPLAGANVITIVGTGFGAGQNALIDGLPCTGISVTGGTTITCTVPASQSGIGAKNLVLGSTASGTQTFNGVYTYRDLPTIQSIAPTSGPQSGNTAIIIGGTNFFGVPAVTIDGAPCANVTVTVPTTVTALTPPSPSGAGAKDVVVTMSASGSVTQTGGFSYNALPVITSVYPNVGSTSGGGAIAIRGSGFAGTVGVLFGTAAGTVRFVPPSQDQIAVDSPSAAGPGPVDVIVTASETGTVTATNAFTYVPPTTAVSFTAPSQQGLTDGPSDTAVADLDGDGDVDFVTVNPAAQNVSHIQNATAPGSTSAQLNGATGLLLPATPFDVAIADVNGDLKPDIAVANGDGGGGQVSFFLNSTPAGGLISFGGRTDVTAGNTTTAVALGDLNGDGKPDLVAASPGSAELRAAINTTAAGAAVPTFDTPLTILISGSQDVALADVNLDGRLDVVVAQSLTSLRVFLNETAPGATTPALSAPTVVFVASSAGQVRAFDVNGDGRSDFAVQEQFAGLLDVFPNETVPGSSNVTLSDNSILLSVPGATLPADLEVGDLNGDGRPDLLIARGPAPHVASVYLNETPTGSPTPTFTAEIPLPINNGTGVAVGDVNLDGRLDVVVANGAVPALEILFNDSPVTGNVTASLGLRVDFATGAQPTALALEDVNRDGRADVATANRASGDPGSSTILLNNTSPGGLIPDLAPTLAVTVNVSPLAVALTDVNGDGACDLLTAAVTPTSTVAVLFNQTVPGTTTIIFGAQTDVTITSTCTALSTPDVDGDGRPDLVNATIDNDKVSVRLNTTAAGAASPSYGAAADFDVAGSGGAEPLVADFNGDFLPDLAVPNGATVSVLLNLTAPGSAVASFAARQDIAVGAALGGGVACDVNRDGRPDIVVTDSTNDVVWVLLNETPAGSPAVTFATPIDFPAATGATRVCAADFTGDGAVDLAVGGAAASIGVFAGTTAPGATTASFAARADFATGSPPVSCAARDVNGDGKPDLVVGNEGANSVSVRLNTR
jgi:hypothetical protein